MKSGYTDNTPQILYEDNLYRLDIVTFQGGNTNNQLGFVLYKKNKQVNATSLKLHDEGIFGTLQAKHFFMLNRAITINTLRNVIIYVKEHVDPNPEISRGYQSALDFFSNSIITP